MGWRRFLFDLLLVGPKSRLSRSYYEEALNCTPAFEHELLTDALNHACEHVTYYRQLRNNLPDTSASAGESPCLADFPLLTKTIVQQRRPDLLMKYYDKSTVYEIVTSGSTGCPIRVMRDEFGGESTRATEDFYFRELLGIDHAEVPSVVFWANSPSVLEKKRNARKSFSLHLTRTSLLGAITFTPTDFQIAADTFNYRRPVLLKGYVSTLLELARYVRKTNTRFYCPRIIVSIAETLEPAVRKFIEETFNCPVYDYYGAREAGPIGGECRSGKMHLFGFHVHTEVLNEQEKSSPPGEEGRVVITHLRDRAMPLIRYDIGDVAVRGTNCTCGVRLSVLERIVGRSIDYFPAEDGSLVSGGYLSRVMFKQPWVDHYVIVQKSFREIEFQYVQNREPLPAEIDGIQWIVALMMGANCKAVFRRVFEVPSLHNGKRTAAYSEIRPRDVT